MRWLERFLIWFLSFLIWLWLSSKVVFVFSISCRLRVVFYSFCFSCFLCNAIRKSLVPLSTSFGGVRAEKRMTRKLFRILRKICCLFFANFVFFLSRLSYIVITTNRIILNVIVTRLILFDTCVGFTLSHSVCLFIHMKNLLENFCYAPFRLLNGIDCRVEWTKTVCVWVLVFVLFFIDDFFDR